MVGRVELTRLDVVDDIGLLRTLPGGDLLAGIRHPVRSEPDPDWLIRPDVQRGLAAVAEAGLVYDLVVTRAQLPATTRAASLLPGLTFVLDHLGNPPISSGNLHQWAGFVRDLAALPNVVCKLSGLVTEADWQHWRTADLQLYAETASRAYGLRGCTSEGHRPLTEHVPVGTVRRPGMPVEEDSEIRRVS